MSQGLQPDFHATVCLLESIFSAFGGRLSKTSLLFLYYFESFYLISVLVTKNIEVLQRFNYYFV